MKKRYLAVLASLITASLSVTSFAQSGGLFVIPKSVIAGGGGNSNGGIFVLDGTVGQSVAGTSSTGGDFAVTGGFWGGAAATATNVTISGRVSTPTGLGLRNAVVSLIDSTGVRRIATTSSFGLYIFEMVPVGQSYTMTVGSKRYRFAPQFVAIQGTLTNINFVGLE